VKNPTTRSAALAATTIAALALGGMFALPAAAETGPVPANPPAPQTLPTLPTIPPLPTIVNDTALVWQGFRHEWTYNHRVNRLGDYVRSQSCLQDVCSATIGHTASSGVGPDTATYRSYYATVNAPGVKFLAGETNLVVRGEEGVTSTVTKPVVVTVPQSMRGRPATVLLNGFDLIAIDALDEPADADKVEDFDLGVSNALINPFDLSTLNFNVTFSFKGACKSVECEWLDTRLDYQLTVRYLLVSAESTDLVTHAPVVLQRGPYTWPEPCLLGPVTQACADREISPASVGAAGARTFTIGANPDFGKLLLGIQRVRLSMDVEHYLLNWDQQLGDVTYNRFTGQVTAFDRQFFKQWRYGMADTYPQGAAASGDSGTAGLALTLAPLAFSNSACVRDNQFIGGSFQPPTGAGNSSAGAVDETPLSYAKASACT
jgi:hypothetical protein